MADTTVDTTLQVEQWERRFFTEYVRNNRFRPYMGASPMAIIHMNERLTREPGQKVTIPLVTRLQGTGVSGNQRLKGNEEALGNYGHKIETTTIRNGVVVTEEEEKKSPFSLMQAARPQLMTWAMEDIRGANGAKRGIIDAMGSISTGVGAAAHYDDATEGQKDNFLDDNTDRFLFGAAKSNLTASDHSASLANIDNTADQLGAAIVSLAKRMAKTADPHIRPFRVAGQEDEEWYVMFCNSQSFRDAKEDSTILQANREAWTRGRQNPIFTDGDLIYDGVIIREVPEIPTLVGVGAGSIDVAPNYLCGAQAVGVGWAMRSSVRTDVDDYGFANGVAVMEMRGVEKLLFQPGGTNSTGIQHGQVTVYTAGVADA